MRPALPSFRRLLLLLSAPALLAAGYAVWTPGRTFTDGRHDRGSNGIWLSHGWLGDDGWFRENGKDPAPFRDPARLRAMAARLEKHGIRYVFPHLCPCLHAGPLPPVDEAQTALFLDVFTNFTVLPWIGGVLDEHARINSPYWRGQFTASAVHLLQRHPRLAGVHLNIEPLPSGDPDFLLLLDDLKRVLPPGKLLSVAAYPPPTRWQPSPDVHWNEAYYREVARRCDQVVPMLYDTGLRLPKLYSRLVADWTAETVAWAAPAPVLLGLPAYDDAGTGYHHPGVENLGRALAGVHAGLYRFKELPPSYAGVALYSEWEMDESEWDLFRRAFNRRPPVSP